MKRVVIACESLGAVMDTFSTVVCGRLRQWQRQRRPRPQGCAALRSAPSRTVARFSTNPRRLSLDPLSKPLSAERRPRSTGISRRPDLKSARCAGETFTPPRLPFPFSPTPPTFAQRSLKHLRPPAFDNRRLSNARPLAVRYRRSINCVHRTPSTEVLRPVAVPCKRQLRSDRSQGFALVRRDRCGVRFIRRFLKVVSDRFFLHISVSFFYHCTIFMNFEFDHSNIYD